MSSAAPLLLINIIKSNFYQKNPGIICCKFITFNTVSSCWRLIPWFSYRAATRFCSTVRRRAARMRRGRETHQTPLENCLILWVFVLGETLSTSWDAFYHKVFTNWTLLNSAYVSIQFFLSFCVKKNLKTLCHLVPAMHLHIVYLHIEWGGEIRSQRITCSVLAATSSGPYGSRGGSRARLKSKTSRKRIWRRTVEVNGKSFLISSIFFPVTNKTATTWRRSSMCVAVCFGTHWQLIYSVV